MSISYEDAISTLKTMFPEWDEETLGTILISNQYHVERTIENILSMCGDVDVSPSPAVQQAPAPSQSHQSAHSSSNRNSAPAPVRQNRQQQQVPMGAPANSGPIYRGINCSLPEDFLRPPGYSSRIFADEELAMMLQNELFQREVRAMFGDDFVAAARGSGARPAGQNSRTQTSVTNSRQPSGDGTAAGGQEDLGIMKAISSMGGAARRNLSMLAQRFSSGQQQTRNGETGNAREFKPLVDNNGDDEDDVDVVSFDTRSDNRSRHVLQDVGETNNDDSENPLFQQGYATNNQLRTHRDV